MVAGAKTLLCSGALMGAFCFFVEPASAQIACLPIRDVIVRDAFSISKARLDALVAPFEGRCLGLQEFNDIIEVVTEAYIEEGLITSRAYLPEQDLADGSFEITVIEGAIEDIRFNGKIDRRWQSVVYPKMTGELAHIRRIEEGLDVIRSMDTYSADMELDPGAEIGKSILNINATTERPWEIKYSTNNYSEEPMGEWSSTITVKGDHLLGLNDQWSLSYTKSMSPSPIHFGYEGFGKEAIAASYTQPYGRWESKLSYSASRYHQEIDGAFETIPVDGWSQSWTADFKRLMHRDQVSKTYLTFSLNRTENENYIMNTLVQSSSRILTSAKLNLSHERPIWDGTLKANIFYERGLKLFGAEDHDDMPPAQPNAQFSLWKLEASYEKAWQFEGGQLDYSTNFAGQYSCDRLYGSQQFAIGGPSTVRGVMGAVATGNSGFFVRQEVEWSPIAWKKSYIGQASVYAGLDYGHIFADKRYDIPSWQATGGVLGMRFEGGFADIDISYGHLLDLNSQSGLNEYEPSGEWMVSITKTF